MKLKEPFEESCAVLRDTAELINSVASANEHRLKLNLQTAATDAVLALNRFIWELRQAHIREGDGKASGHSG
jgi:hypothetical protein